MSQGDTEDIVNTNMKTMPLDHNQCLLSAMAKEEHIQPQRVILNKIRQEKTIVYLYDGITMCIRNGAHQSPQSICCYDVDPCLWFVCQIGGNSSLFFNGQQWDMKPGNMMVAYGTDQDREIHSYPGCNFGCVYIRLGQMFLQKHFQHGIVQNSGLMSRLTKNNRSMPILYSGSVSPGISLALQQLSHSPFNAPLEMLFVESRILDIVCDSLSLVFGETADKDNISLSRQDVEKIHHIRELLIEDLTASPPSIKKLAMSVGINEFKLKKGFRSLFKTSIHTYHRNARMDLARTLLSEGLHNVCEVACAVGYSNPSHFSRAFHNQYNINPGAYLRDIRNKGFHANAATSRVTTQQ